MLLLAVAAASGIELRDERLVVTDDGGAALEVTGWDGSYRTRQRVVRVAAGPFRVTYEARVPAASPPPDTGTGPLDEDGVVALRQSRYCPSDRLDGFARFVGGVGDPPSITARRIANWVFEHVAYEPGWSGPTDGALETLGGMRGVCRDFTHLTISLCRARGIPARMVSAYAPGLSPMDFHAVVEAHTEAGWEILDPTRLAPRSSLVRIATGRDAADTAFATTLSGDVLLDSAEIVAVVDGELPLDDHESTVCLA